MESLPHISELRKYVNKVTHISDEAFNLILPYVEFKAIKKGELLYEQEKRCNYIFCIRNGIFRSFVENENNDRTRWFAIEGDFITSMYAYTTGRPSASSVEAVSKGEVWTIKVSDFKKILDISDHWARWMLYMLSEGFGIWEDRDRYMISGDAYARLKNFYIFKSGEIFTQIPLRHIASYLKITPQTMSVLRRRLIDEIRETNKKK